jgi:DNA-binding LytR/AlgR family response regulator
MKVRTLVVDDEKHARKMLENYVLRFSNLELVATFANTKDTQSCLLQQQIDLIFLDIQMPKQTGIEFLKQLTAPPQIVFTTAFQDYALEGYELNVLDYLLKPIGFNRFNQAVQKAIHHFSNKEKIVAYEIQKNYDNQFIIIKEGFTHHKIFLKDLLYISSMQEYVQYHTTKGKHMELNSLTNLEKILPTTHFVRIHRSYIISKSAVNSKATKQITLNNGKVLPIGKTFKGKISMVDFE